MVESTHSLPGETSSVFERLDTPRHRHCRRRTLVILVTVAFPCGLALNWSWLVIVGVGSLLLAAFLCIAMCVVGLGRNLDSNRSCTTAAGPSSAPLVGPSPQ